MERVRVLCVDDNADLLGALRIMLSTSPGIECVGTLTSTRGLTDEVDRLKPDVVLMDYTMPGEDTLEALARLKRGRPDLACAMLSGYDDPDTVRAATRAGACRCLSKDIEPDRLIEFVRSAAPGGPDGTR
jgi:DNA-binding NarL/FixJ family response regulator